MVIRKLRQSYCHTRFWLTNVRLLQETKTQYIAEIELCLNTTFTPMECPKNRQQQVQTLFRYPQDVHSMVRQGSSGESRPCADTEPVAYPIIHYN